MPSITDRKEKINQFRDNVSLNGFFIERYDELIDNLTFSFSFTDCLYFKYKLENLKNEFCITKILCHLLFCSKSPVLSSPCRLCSRLFVRDSDDFVSSVKHHFSYVLVNAFNNKEIESLFTNERKMSFKLDLLYFSKTHSGLVNSTQNRCMNVLIVTSPSDLVIVLSEMYVRILLNIFYSISNDTLKMPGEYKGMDSIE